MHTILISIIVQCMGGVLKLIYILNFRVTITTVTL